MPKKTGPKTPQGLAISSQNAITHNMTSTRPLLSTESQADRDAHHQQWHLQYPTTNEIAHRLVTRAANSEWHLLRLERQFEAIASTLLALSVATWSDANHSLYQNTQRYLTTAQRAHHRDRLAIQQYRAEIRAEEARQANQESAQPQKSSNHDLLREMLKRPPPRSDMPLSQTITVYQDDDGTSSEFSMPNTQQILEKTDNVFETTRIIRCLRFRVRQAPPGYQWAQAQLDLAAPDSNDYREVFLHMTAKSFRIAVERENKGPVQFWQDLDDLDKPILESKVIGLPMEPLVSPR